VSRWDRFVETFFNTRVMARYLPDILSGVVVTIELAALVVVTGIAAGLHAVLRLPPGTEPSVVRAAAHQGLAVDGLTPRHRHPDAVTTPLDALVVGYGTPPEHAFEAAVTALGDLLGEAATMRACPREIRSSRR